MFFTERLANLIAPSACLLCASEGSILCHDCQASALPPAPGCCYLCLIKVSSGAICLECRNKTPFHSVTASTAYDGISKRLVHDYKFAHRRGYAKAMAEAMTPCISPCPPGTVVTYVPTAARRKRERGYDQAALLAQALSKQLQLPCVALLERRGNNRQVGTNRTVRRHQLQYVFRPLRPHVIDRSPVLLIDDILTTGGTLEAAANVLQQAGATCIMAAVFAQAL